MNRVIQFFLLCSILIIPLNVNAKGEKGFDRSQFYSTKISPDGKHLAVSMALNDKVGLVFLDRKTLAPVGRVQFPGTHEVGYFRWVNDERVVINMLQRFPSKKYPQLSGELYAINSDGAMGEMIYGYQAGERQTGSLIRARKSIQGNGEVIDILPEDDKHILISSTPTVMRGNEYIVEEGLATVYKLNVYTGVIRNKVVKSPIAHAEFLTNANGEVKVVYGRDKNNTSLLYVRKNDSWIKVPKSKKEIVGDSLNLISLSESGKELYALGKSNAEAKEIFKLNLDDYSYSQVFTNQDMDISNIEKTTNNRDLYAVKLNGEHAEYHFVNNQLDEAKIFKKLLNTFPGSEIKITSKEDKGNLYVAVVAPSQGAETVYLYDNKNNKISVLFQLKANSANNDVAKAKSKKQNLK